MDHFNHNKQRSDNTGATSCVHIVFMTAIFFYCFEIFGKLKQMSASE